MVGASCDFRISPDVVGVIEEAFEADHSVDCFATAENAVVPWRFFSAFACVGSSAVDAFTRDWGAEDDCFLHPPRSKIGATIRHLEACGGRGTLVCPLDSTRVWWPLVAAGARGTVPGGRLRFERRRGLLRGDGDRPLPAGSTDLMAIRLDFRSRRGRKPLEVDSTPPMPGLKRRLRRELDRMARSGRAA